MYLTSLKDLDACLTTWVRSFEETKAKFLADLDKNPVHALAWSEDMYQKAARYGLAQHYLRQIADRAEDLEAGNKVIDEAEALNNIRTHALRNAINGALYSGSSSGTLHNLSKRYETTAWAELAALFDQIERQVGFGVAA